MITAISPSIRSTTARSTTRTNTTPPLPALAGAPGSVTLSSPAAPRRKGHGAFAVTACSGGAAISNALVSIDGRPDGATLSNGTYDAVLTAASHSYSVAKTGVGTQTGNFTITNGQITNVNVAWEALLVPHQRQRQRQRHAAPTQQHATATVTRTATARATATVARSSTPTATATATPTATATLQQRLHQSQLRPRGLG